MDNVVGALLEEPELVDLVALGNHQLHELVEAFPGLVPRTVAMRPPYFGIRVHGVKRQLPPIAFGSARISPAHEVGLERLVEYGRERFGQEAVKRQDQIFAHFAHVAWALIELGVDVPIRGEGHSVPHGLPVRAQGNFPV